MKTFHRLTAMAVLLACGVAHSGPALTEPEKDALHLSTGVAFGYLASAFGSDADAASVAVLKATALGMVPGVLKEVSDRRLGANGSSIRRDLRTDLTGVLLGIALERGTREYTGWRLTGFSRSQGVTQLVVSRAM